MSEETSYRDYWAHVGSLAQEARDQANDGYDATDAIHELVDSSWWVIYTHANIACLMHSRSEDAAFDDMGSDALSGCSSFGEVVQRLAFFALRQDVQDAFYALPEPEEPEEEEPEEPQGGQE